MHTGTRRKYVIKPINQFADGCPARRVGENEISLLDFDDKDMERSKVIKWHRR